MKNIKIEILTPVHIGSGRDLSADTEFLQFKEIDEEYEDTVLAVIDEEKVLDIIGAENIDKWTDIIKKNGDFKEYLLQRKNDLKADDISKRKIIAFADDISRNKTLKEQMFDGRQKPYIPSSSIKGAIRTAILAEAANNNKEFAKRNIKGNRGFSGQELERKLFGGNPNEDVFRFLQVGDAYFDYSTIAIKAEIFNMFKREWNFKRNGSQLIEAIPNEAEAEFRLKINSQLLSMNKPRVKTDFLEEKSLFSIINNHTKKLLMKELEFANEISTNEDAFTGYKDTLSDLISNADNCKENEAILRIGFGSGWNFITGGWATDEGIMNDFDYEKFLKTVRRKNYDEDVPFPKSRKIGDEGDMFGFVKLKIEE